MMRRLNFIVLGLALVVSACTLGPTAPQSTITPGSTPEVIETPPPDVTPQAGELSPEQIQTISQATVQVIAASEASGSLEPLQTGSGVLISADGQIVTNCHIACGAPVLVILLTTNLNQPPEALYRAEVTASDQDLDLAVLQINQNSGGTPLDSSTLSLPFLPQGDPGALRFGDSVRIFGYPSTGGQIVTFISGTVSGFETGQVGSSDQRVAINTDAVIDSGTSGGPAVDLQGRLLGVATNVASGTQTGGVALGGGGRLVPINLVANLGRGEPAVTDGERRPPIQQDQYEPNNTLGEAAGPLTTGQSVQAYIGTDQDVDVFYFDTATNSPISANLTDIPSGADYDLYIYSGGNIVAQSENQGSVDESAEFRPGAPGRFHVAVSGFQSSNDQEPYTLTVTFDGGRTSVGAISVRGTVINGNTGRPFERGVMGILNPGVTCDDFFGAPSLNMGLVAANVSTGPDGSFTLTGVVTGESYATFFFSGNNHQCQNGWLTVPEGSSDITLDPITLAF